MLLFQELRFVQRLRFAFVVGSISAIMLQLSTTFAHSESIGDGAEFWRLKLGANFTAPGSHNARVDHNLYRVDFVCKSNGMPPLPQKNIVDLAVMRSVTTSHSLLISKSYVQPDAAGKLKIPETPLLLLTPYSVNGSNVVDNRSLCPKEPLIIAGAQSIYLYPMVSYSTTNTPGAIVKIGYAIAKLIPALWSIFQPEVIAADINRKLTSVGETKGPMEEILATFNKDLSFGKGFNLDVGTYKVATDFSDITITVSRMESIVLAKPSSLQENFRARLKSAPEQINADSVGTTCAQIAVALKEAGFSEEQDIPYALTALSSKLGTKPKMVACLQSVNATEAALKLGPVLWSWIPSALVLKKEYLDGLQPSSFSDAKSRIYNLIVALSRITKGDPARAAEGLAQLKLVATEKIKLTDTIDGHLGGTTDLAPADFAARLIERKYFRFGCMAPVGEKNGQGISNGVGSFLVIKAPADASSAKLSDALPVHVIFKGGLVSEIAAFQESPWTKVNLDANEGNCNGFRLTATETAGLN